MIKKTTKRDEAIESLRETKSEREMEREGRGERELWRPSMEDHVWGTDHGILSVFLHIKVHSPLHSTSFSLSITQPHATEQYSPRE